ncbi:hypothetical protein BGI36_01345 [Snodgrassella communis]|uniref:hypothetical protein n=1 Tax=Snodgrassella communis TaxID=2946699 RepID=UPI000C1ECC44|nr:hypothetical protein [Snodgrassella communis]PIT20875.1 hypothetical protein BGI36_07195 [Snodgrassella communis]PIT22382.1 hypothetical protein BGI36_03430 [Snodgrassella communis]PIT23294.1 hypothetical protein BGI36_01650 [Snodgrassella communis]PIT24100.1 hypothetical protein BGI36_01345 [Snodgrassella communis]
MKYVASRDINVTNPEPHGYWDLMAQIDAEQDADDLLERNQEVIKERLADDELVDIADEAIGELYASEEFCELMLLVTNELAKAIYLGGHYKQQTVGQILSHLPLEAEKMVIEYIKENAN